ncbi:MAG: hypothetical protein JNN20_07150 [Betaproteobacteria bacterium]|nr:hypothetical protein [Betaproteobacteria bacterium]
MTPFRKLLLIWMIAWLPLSGAMAAVMPFGMAKSSSTMAVAVDMNVDAMDDSASAMPCHSQSDSGATASGTCNHCELCHLAGALVAPTLPLVDASVTHDSPISFVRSNFISFFPEQPQRPPLPSRI